jgi:hypothetical protein
MDLKLKSLNKKIKKIMTLNLTQIAKINQNQLNKWLPINLKMFHQTLTQ